MTGANLLIVSTDDTRTTHDQLFPWYLNGHAPKGFYECLEETFIFSFELYSDGFAINNPMV